MFAVRGLGVFGVRVSVSADCASVCLGGRRAFKCVRVGVRVVIAWACVDLLCARAGFGDAPGMHRGVAS